jgi:NAD(P)-dependent dehydrogenase (short-subunit alcohol dehydrogenase family)/acyl carrier protein
MVLSADVANQHHMQDAIRLVYERFGHIHGVIHAAGIAGGGIIQLKTAEMADRVLAPKVQGTLVLKALLQGVELDFFALCSSITSILGGLGQVDYCAANAFLDAFAHGNDSRNRRLLVSINWDTWQEVGMAVNTAVPKALEARRQATLKTGILASEGMDVFARLLGTTASQVIVATRDFQSAVRRNNAHAAALAVEKPREVAASTPVHPRPDPARSYVPPRSEMERTIADIWQELLGIEQVGIHDGFFELGGHSLLAMQVISRMRASFHVAVSLHRFFETPTVAGLAEAIEKAKGNDSDPQASAIVPISREVYRIKRSWPSALTEEGRTTE